MQLQILAEYNFKVSRHKSVLYCAYKVALSHLLIEFGWMKIMKVHYFNSSDSKTRPCVVCSMGVNLDQVSYERQQNFLIVFEWSCTKAKLQEILFYRSANAALKEFMPLKLHRDRYLIYCYEFNYYFWQLLQLSLLLPA